MLVLMAVTNLGDLAVLLPLALLVLLWLLGMGRRREALWWVAALVLCAGGTAVLKIYFFVCPLIVDLSSPNGHASLSTLVYGAMIMVVAAECGRKQRPLVMGAGAALVLAIALSRVLLRAHSPDEVILGILIGSGALVLFAQTYLANPPKGVRLRSLLIAAVVLVVALHGHELHAEASLHAIGLYLREAGMARWG